MAQGERRWIVRWLIGLAVALLALWLASLMYQEHEPCPACGQPVPVTKGDLER